MRLTDKMEELDVAMDRIESDYLEFLNKFPNAGRTNTTLPGQPSAPRSGPRYSPVNLILESESKDKPWILASTQAIPYSQITTMRMWLESGGTFQDVEEPIRYLKTLLDMPTFQSYRLAIDARIATATANGTQVTVDMLIDTLNTLVPDRMPLSNRRVKYLRRAAKTGQMGSRGSRVVEFFRELNAKVNSASLLTLDW